jgi:hypothetical protein
MKGFYKTTALLVSLLGINNLSCGSFSTKEFDPSTVKFHGETFREVCKFSKGSLVSSTLKFICKYKKVVTGVGILVCLGILTAIYYFSQKRVAAAPEGPAAQEIQAPEGSAAQEVHAQEIQAQEGPAQGHEIVLGSEDVKKADLINRIAIMEYSLERISVIHEESQSIPEAERIVRRGSAEAYKSELTGKSISELEDLFQNNKGKLEKIHGPKVS